MARVPPESTRKSLESASLLFHKSLSGSPAAEYLKQRGILRKAQVYFRLGFVNPKTVPAEYREFTGMLSIPYLVGETVVGIKFRRLDDREEMRYLNTPGFFAKRFFCPQTFMGLDPKVYVCEGEIDTITLWQLGVPSVGVPGANAWEPLMGRAFRSREVVVIVDGKGKSEIGKKQGLNLAKQVLTSVDEGSRIILDDSDVNQFYLDHGADRLLEEIGWKSGS